MYALICKQNNEREGERRGREGGREGEGELAEEMKGDRYICIICLVILIQHYFVSNTASVSHNSSSL